MLQPNQVRKGMVIDYEGEPALVLSHFIQNMGRAGAHNKTKLRVLTTGATVSKTYSGNEKVAEVEVNKKSMQFLYIDDRIAYFMDPESYEQISIPVSEIPEEDKFLKEGEKYVVAFYEGEVLSVQLPKTISLKVTSAIDAVKGDTANNALKEVTVETGAEIMVPLFIKQGEIITVNTDSSEYTGKDN